MEIGDTVLHPRYGVGIIESVEKRLEDGVARDYFVIPKPSISSKIFVPVDTADELGLRPLTTAEKLEQVLSILSGEADDTNLCSEDYKINWGNPIDLARAVRTSLLGPKQRYPTANQLKHARQLLSEELSAVLDIPEGSIDALVDKPAKSTRR